MTTPLAALALLAAGNMLDWAPYGLFVTLWHGFFLGVLAYEAGYLKQSPVLLLLLVAVTLVGAVGKESVFGAPAAFTAVGLFVAGRTGHLVHGLKARGLQMLGTISYSLYLIHIPVMHAGFASWGRIAGRGAVQDSLGLIIVLSGTLGAATIFWWLFERPSHRVAVKLFRRHNASPVLT